MELKFTRAKVTQNHITPPQPQLYDNQSPFRIFLGRQLERAAIRPGWHNALEKDSTHSGVWKQSGETEKIQKLKKDLL